LGTTTQFDGRGVAQQCGVRAVAPAVAAVTAVAVVAVVMRGERASPTRATLPWIVRARPLLLLLGAPLDPRARSLKRGEHGLGALRRHRRPSACAQPRHVCPAATAKCDVIFFRQDNKNAAPMSIPAPPCPKWVDQAQVVPDIDIDPPPFPQKWGSAMRCKKSATGLPSAPGAAAAQRAGASDVAPAHSSTRSS